MKPAAFELAIPAGIEAAAALLAGAESRAMGGGQSLGPMLNFRAARPVMVVPLTGLAALQGVEDTADAITLGAATTHADIADRRTPDLAGGILARIAAGIAYRAVRNRGTIGGSLCHADPGADWLTTLTALGAIMLTTRRAVALDQFVTGPYRTVLEPGEIVRAVRIPRPPAGSGWGYHKLCRKPGEFAHAMAAALVTPGGRRLVLGAVGGPPILLQDGQATLAGAEAALAFQDPVTRRIQLVAVDRAFAEAGA
jgi:carbon-monoxide dehydrogenase medium subunit